MSGDKFHEPHGIQGGGASVEEEAWAHNQEIETINALRQKIAETHLAASFNQKDVVGYLMKQPNADAIVAAVLEQRRQLANDGRLISVDEHGRERLALLDINKLGLTEEQIEMVGIRMSVVSMPGERIGVQHRAKFEGPGLPADWRAADIAKAQGDAVGMFAQGIVEERARSGRGTGSGRGGAE